MPTVSSYFQSIPGPEITALYTAPNSVVVSSLGRNLAAGAAGTTQIQLVEPGTLYEKRTNQVDFRVSKVVRMGQYRVQGMFDLYNLFNVSPLFSLNTTYGAAWQRPTAILPGRLAKFGVQVDF